MTDVPLCEGIPDELGKFRLALRMSEAESTLGVYRELATLLCLLASTRARLAAVRGTGPTWERADAGTWNRFATIRAAPEPSLPLPIEGAPAGLLPVPPPLATMTPPDPDEATSARGLAAPEGAATAAGPDAPRCDLVIALPPGPEGDEDSVMLLGGVFTDDALPFIRAAGAAWATRRE